MKRIAIAVPVAAALLAAGCGSSDKPASDVDKVTAVINDLGKSARDGKTDKICSELFTSNLAQSVANASKRTCAAEVAANIAGPDTTFSVTAVNVNGDNANAGVTDQAGRKSDILLQRVDGTWRIARIGTAS